MGIGISKGGTGGEKEVFTKTLNGTHPGLG